MPTWLEDIAGPNFAPAVLWTLLALVVLVIVLVIIRIVRSMTFGTFVAGGRNRKTRLAVMDAAAVDSHRRLVLVRRDDVEHLILIGGPTDVVVERDIRLHAPARRPANSGESAADAPAAAPRAPAPNGQPHPEQRRPAPVAQAAQPARPAQPAAAQRVPQPAPVAAPPVAKPPAAPLLKPAPPRTPPPSVASQPNFSTPRAVPVPPPPPVPAPVAKPRSNEIDPGFANEPGRSEPAKKKPEMTLEDEMNRLLGELSSKR
jgi:hypothetical protein